MAALVGREGDADLSADSISDSSTSLPPPPCGLCVRQPASPISVITTGRECTGRECGGGGSPGPAARCQWHGDRDMTMQLSRTDADKDSPLPVLSPSMQTLSMQSPGSADRSICALVV